ncbi:MAG: ATP-binding protein [Planctomycetota bacterium]|nr:ATP-binding protein [Planctomycetota bacterium]
MCKPRLLWQVFLLHLAIMVVLMLGLEFYASSWARQFYTERKQSELEIVAELSQSRLVEALDRRAYAELQALCDELAALRSMRITVILPSGEVVADTDENPQQMDNHADRPEVELGLHGQTGRSTRWSHTVGESLTYVAVPLRRGQVVAAVVRTAFPVQALAQTFRTIYQRIALVGLLVLVLAGSVSLLVARKIIQPLEVLRRGAERFARGELKHRLPSVGAEEIRMVAQSLNHMAEELDQRLETIVRQENEHEAVLSSMVEGVLAVDHAGTILSLNETCAELLGVRTEQARGRLIHEVFRHSGLLAFVDEALTSPDPVEQDLEASGPDMHWLHAHGTVLHDGQQRKIGALVVLHDVTRLRHLEKIRRDFVANVSHELKTPITSIKGFVETLLHEQFENKDNSLRFLGIILRQVNRLDAIIGDLLMLSRLERGSEEQTIQLERLAVADVLQAAGEMCVQKAADKQLRLEVDCPADLQAEINAPLLEQAVTNLIDNAIKYSEAGESIRITAASVGDDVLICVTDQGCGIEAVHLPRLFERFYRVDRARSRELGGTGLGLAIVKHIVVAHGGRIHVESTVGAGSTFTLQLPACRTTDPVPVSAA